MLDDIASGRSDTWVNEIDEALRRLAGPDVEVGARQISAADVAGLSASEYLSVARSVPLRQREFASGRALLREVIGFGGSIPVRENRSPQLPAGIVGSLAHDRQFAVAAISRHPDVLSLGIDIEPMDPLNADMARVILRSDEHLDAHLAFTLKEATYKAWSGLGGRMLDHGDVRLSLNGDRFDAEVRPDDVIFHGYFAMVRNRCVALVTSRR